MNHLIHEYRDGCQDAFIRLMDYHTGLVTKIVHEEYSSRGEFEDLVSAGREGLIEAFNKFDIDRGTKFSSYARWWIKNYIRSYLAKNRLISITTAAETRINFVWRFIQSYQKEHGKYPSDKTILSNLPKGNGMSVSTLNAIRTTWSSTAFSLDDISSETDESYHNVVGSEDPLPSELALKKMNFEDLLDLIKSGVLTERQSEIIVRRFGTEEPETLKEIANDFGITHEAVRASQARALQILKTVLMD